MLLIADMVAGFILLENEYRLTVQADEISLRRKSLRDQAHKASSIRKPDRNNDELDHQVEENKEATTKKWKSIPLEIIPYNAVGANNISTSKEILERSHEYKPGRSLTIYAHQRTNQKLRAAAVFIHGGGFHSGSAKLFEPHAQYYARQGMVGISISYQLANTTDPESSPLQSVLDVKSALRWLRIHANQLGIDPKRIAVLGDSSGGYLALAAALFPGLDALDDNLGISPKPDLLVLFNPVLDTGPLAAWGMQEWSEMVKRRLAKLSPLKFITPGAPPTLVIHGTADRVTPISFSERLVTSLKSAGAKAKIAKIEGVGHAFIIEHLENSLARYKALKITDHFMRENGF